MLNTLVSWYSDYHSTNYHENFRKLMMILHAESRADTVAVVRAGRCVCVSHGGCDFSARQFVFPGEILDTPSRFWDRAPSWVGNLVTSMAASTSTGTTNNLLVMTQPSHTIWFVRVSSDFVTTITRDDFAATATILAMCVGTLLSCNDLQTSEAKVTEFVDQVADAVRPIGKIIKSLSESRSPVLPMVRLYAENIIRVIDRQRILQSNIKFKFTVVHIEEILIGLQTHIPENAPVYTDAIRMREIVHSLCTAKSWVLVDMQPIDLAAETSTYYPDYQEQAYQLTFNITEPSTVDPVMERLAWLLDGKIICNNNGARAIFTVYASAPTKFSTSSLRLVKNKTVLVVGEHREFIQKVLTQLQLNVSIAATTELAMVEFPQEFDCAMATAYTKTKSLVTPSTLPAPGDTLEYKTALVRAVISAITSVIPE